MIRPIMAHLLPSSQRKKKPEQIPLADGQYHGRRLLRRQRRRRHDRRALQRPRGLLQGPRRLLRVPGEGGGQDAHRDCHRRPPLPCRVQEVPRRLRPQLPPHLGEALRPAVLRQEASA